MRQIRALFSQTNLLAKDLVMPYFVIEGANKKERIERMPGIYRLSIDNLIKDLREAKLLGIKAALLFGICRKKDGKATAAYSESGIVQKAIKAVRRNIKDMVIITDVCLCGYTSHGHCGIVKQSRTAGGQFIIDNDKTLSVLAKVALSHARAGADFVAPSAMMDGQVRALREILDQNDFKDIGILAYSAKYASNFYGPFREALSSNPMFGDRKAYQMDFRNSNEALREIEHDIEEGADIVMIKPALAYLDIIARARALYKIPIAAYNVSGEYTMLKNYCQDKEEERRLAFEILTSIKRAGADIIISYYAKKVAKWIKEARH
jgi:porphobilinogen synthase